jgi:hypothetical protein
MFSLSYWKMAEQKQNVVGITHIGDPLLVARIAEDNFGIPQKLMLELPDDWEDELEDFYFSKIARYFRERGTQVIIAGDPERYMNMCAIHKPWYKWLLSKTHEAAADGEYVVAFLWRFIGYTLYNLNFQYYHHLYSLLNKNRYAAFVRVFKEEQPELTITGYLHAEDIKRDYPHATYTRIHWKRFRDLLFNMCRQKLTQLLSRSITPDRSIFAQLSHPLPNDNRHE